MDRYFILRSLIPFLVLFLAPSCDRENQTTDDGSHEREEEQIIYVDGDELVFPAKKGTQKAVTLTAFEDCSISLEGNDSAWLEMIDENGRAVSSLARQTAVTLYLKTLKSNYGDAERAADIVVSAGETTNRVSIVQSNDKGWYSGIGKCNPESVEFQSGSSEIEIRVSAYENDLDVEAGSLDWLSHNLPTVLAADDDYVFTLKVQANTTGSERTGTITFTEKNSGQSFSVPVSQKPVTLVGNALPARWEYNADNLSPYLEMWTGRHVSYAMVGAGKDLANITVVSGGAGQPVFTDETAYKHSLGVSNITTGDYYLFTVPVTSLDAGTAVDFMITMDATSLDAPKYWIFEYFEDGEWKSVPADLKTAVEDPSVKYSLYNKFFSSYQHTTFVQSFTLSDTVRDELRMRLRVVGSINGAGTQLSPCGAVTYIVPFEFKSCTITAYPGVPLKDSRKIGILGNSFTHYHATAWKLKEIARSQGHDIRMRIHVKGSQTFADHLNLERSQEVWADGGFEYAILQEQSTTHSSYYQSPILSAVKNAYDLSNKFRDNSAPGGCTVILENTWPFPSSSWQGFGSMDDFAAALTGGAKQIAEKTNCWVSPIADAFRKAYNEYGVRDLWHTDSKHQNQNGAYLKACVNYLVLYGEEFDSNVSDCDIDPDVAAKLRSAAQETVLGHESEYRIQRGVVPSRPSPIQDDSDGPAADADNDYISFREAIGGSSNTNVSAEPYTSKGGKFTLTFSQGTNSNPPKFYWESAHVRVYSGNGVTIAAKDGRMISSIVFETTSGYELGGSTSRTPDSGSVSGNTWKGSASSVSFSGGTGTQFRPQKATVYFK